MQPAEVTEATEATEAAQAVEAKVAYVMKMYPRFSETFIVNEILAHEAAGADLEIVSLRPPVDGRFHASLAEVRAPVTYLMSTGLKAQVVWDCLAEATAELPELGNAIDELLRVEVRDAVQAVELARLVRARGITHLHAHFGSVATTVTRLAALITGVGYSFTAHAKDIFHESVEHDDLRAKLADAVAVVTVSDFNLRHLRGEFGDAADRVVRVYNGLDLDRFRYDVPADRPPLVVSVGRLVEKKGFADLVTACALLIDRGVSLRCEIVGSGPEEAALRAQIAALGVTDHVALLGPRAQDEVKRIVGSAAAFAAPCVVGDDGNRDGLPTVLLEAMALGTPCVATDVTGIPEILSDGETGLGVGQHRPDELADALERLLADAELRVDLAARARKLIEDEFDVARQAAAVRALFATPALARSA